MSSIKRIILAEVPASLEQGTQCFVENSLGGYDAYIGDNGNLPKLIGKSLITSKSITDADAPYTVNGALAKQIIVLADATNAVITVTLPPAASFKDQKITVKKVDSSANAITVEGDSAETIDGVANISVAAQYDWVTVYSDGTSIHVVSKT